jgi:hypothetical protein
MSFGQKSNRHLFARVRNYRYEYKFSINLSKGLRMSKAHKKLKVINYLILQFGQMSFGQKSG